MGETEPVGDKDDHIDRSGCLFPGSPGRRLTTLELGARQGDVAPHPAHDGAPYPARDPESQIGQEEVEGDGNRDDLEKTHPDSSHETVGLLVLLLRQCHGSDQTTIKAQQKWSYIDLIS